MNTLLSITKDQYTQNLNFSDALSFGTEMLLLGMGAVFAVLGVIWAALTIFKFALANQGAKPKKEAAKVESIPAPAPVATSDAEIVAVIAAAIAMAESESGDGIKFRVVSFRRK